MKEPLILYIETSTTVCSAALSRGDELIAFKEVDEDKTHASLLTPFLREVMEIAQVQAPDIDAIAVSKGPGSYTGLRIGVSVAKGFAYASEKPVIGIVSLEAMANGALEFDATKKLLENHPNALLCPMIDARRMEVFSAIYSAAGECIEKVGANIIDENSFKEILDQRPVIFFGNGASKIASVIQHENAHIVSDFKPSARYMIAKSNELFRKKEFEDTAYFEPFYLKDFVATTPKKKVL